MSTLVGQGPLDASRALWDIISGVQRRRHRRYALVEAVDEVLLRDRLAVGRDLLEELEERENPHQRPQPYPQTSDSESTYRIRDADRKSTRLNSSHSGESRMPSSA